MTNKSKNYYEILGCQSTDSTEIIKRAYQNLLLKYHPDKRQQNATEHIEMDNELTVQRIDEAWKCLRDPKQKSSYDAEMQQSRFNSRPIIHETITSNDFSFNSEFDAYTYPCRCGGLFVKPDESELNVENSDENNEIFIECDECSLVIQLTRRT